MLVLESIEHFAGITPEKTAIVFEDERCTYAELKGRINGYAERLHDLGIRKGDRAALLLNNSMAYFYSILGLFSLGALAIPVRTQYKSRELERLLRHSKSSFLISEEAFQPLLEDLGSGLKAKLLMKETDLATETVHSKQHALAERQPGETAIALYTSGTSSDPKGCVFTFEGLYHAALNKTMTLHCTPDDISLNYSEPSHATCITASLIPMLLNGATVVQMKHFEASGYIDHLRKYRPTWLYTIPVQLLEILEHPALRREDLTSVTRLLSTGDKASQKLYDLYKDISGRDLIESMGMTECPMYCVQPPELPKKISSIGKCAYGCEMRLVDGDLNDVERGEGGEILVRSKARIAYYLDDEEATRQAFVNGWFRTGDMACEDEDGYYFFRSRIKEIIVVGGSNVSPPEVENIINSFAAVEESAVIGLADETYGQRVVAFVEPKKDRELHLESLKVFVKSSLADYKIPVAWHVVDKLPINTVGKIDRRALHEWDLS